MRKFKCECTGIEEFGVYTRMKVFEYNGKCIQVDSCMVDEIKYLLDNGVKTIASCCGHKKTEGFIGVDEESIQMMKSLEYEKHINPCYPKSNEFFKPKTK